MKEKRKEKQVEENVELEEDEALMAKLMGFKSFDTTKVRHCTITNVQCYIIKNVIG